MDNFSLYRGMDYIEVTVNWDGTVDSIPLIFTALEQEETSSNVVHNFSQKSFELFH